MKRMKLQVEELESRRVPAVWGNPWPQPESLTLSFVPDGTQVAGQSSVLFQELDAVLPRDVWQREVVRAFQTWARHSGINLSVVEDDGGAFGSSGPLQSGEKRADIRIGSIPLAHSELAVATPFDLLSDWSGDVVLNANALFTAGGRSGGYDLFTVMLQEAGHVFGLPNSPDAASAMFTTYRGPRTGLAAADVDALRGLYGTRPADALEGSHGNATMATATALQFVYDVDQFSGSDPTAFSPPFVAHADLGVGDVDMYRFTLPDDLKDFSVELRTSGISLLTANVTVLNSAGQVLATRSATNPLTGDLALFITRPQAGGTYFLRVQQAAGNAFGVGGYRLAVGKEAHEAIFPSADSFLNDDRGDDDDGTNEPLVTLAARTTQTSGQWDYTHLASISYQGDYDRYLVSAPVGASSHLVVTAWQLDTEKLEPKVSVFDAASGQRLTGEILRNDRGVYTLQFRNVAPGTALELQIEAADPNGSFKEGNYFLGANFVASPVNLENFASGTLTQQARQDAQELTMNESRLMHFVLSASSQAGGIDTAVRASIYNSAREVVATFVARAGEAVSLDVLLAPGTYTVRFATRSRDGSTPVSLTHFNLVGLARNDPIGPQLVPPSGNPAPPPKPIYTWRDIDGIPVWIGLEDAFGDPWSGV